MKPKYLPGLDGLRTAAILLVILTHFPNGWVPEFPGREAGLYLLGGSGKIGVSILFVLTGFLMARRHPRPASAVDFWGRRIARIFPLFLVMVMSLTIIRSHPGLPPLASLGIVLGFGLLARLFARPIGRKLTLVWLGLMAAAALGYVFWLNRIPPAVYYQVWPGGWRTAVTAIANAAMVLPFGRYIPQLDGVYWALILEMWFYLLYPVLFVPLAHKFKPVMFPAALLFCFGLSLLADRLWGLKMLEPVFILYFIVGVALGRNLNRWKKRVRPLPIWLVLILLAAGQYYLTSLLPEFYYPWMRLLLAPLAGLAVLSATFKQPFFARPVFSRFSRYTYAAFLTHSLVIDQIFTGGLIMMVISLIVVLILSVILYHLAERPWLITRPLANTKPAAPGKKPLIILTLVMLALLDRAFRPPLAFFTTFARHGWDRQTISLRPEAFRLEFMAAANNLGMITTHLKSTATASGQLTVRLKDAVGQIIQETNYKAADIYENNYHPFGFPVEPQSQGQTYALEFILNPVDPARPVTLIADEQQFISVYFNREISGRWLVNKLLAPLSSPLYWITLFHLLPLVFLFIGRWRRG